MSTFVWDITALKTGRESATFPEFRRSSAEVRRFDVNSDMFGRYVAMLVGKIRSVRGEGGENSLDVTFAR